jgi:hypothetical protein
MESTVASQMQKQLQAKINAREAVLTKSFTEAQKIARHKCFVSYHHADQVEAEKFIDDFEKAFIPRVVGVSDEDTFIDSDDTDYVMAQIREKYLTDSTVTIVLVGKCTWARRYIDWEVYSTLRDDKINKRSGLLGITLPSAADLVSRKLPDRVDDNVDGDKLYARWWKYPASATSLQSKIEQAFEARTSKANLVKNSRARRMKNSTCE